MTKAERQLQIGARMYKHKAWGRENICRYCWACYHYRKCIAGAKDRTEKCLCVAAETRSFGFPRYQEGIKDAVSEKENC